MANKIACLKLQTSIAPADWAHLVELAEIMSIPTARLAEMAIRDFLLNNRRRLLDHYS